MAVSHTIVVRVRSDRSILGPTTQGIREYGFGARAVDNLEVESRQEFRPSHLSLVQGLGCREILEVFVIGDDLEGVRGTLQFWSPFFALMMASSSLS